ncbi:MAG: MFS transporter [Chthoniobacterales bacterium]
MAQRREIITVYVAAVIQGVALVTFPAASTVFTNPAQYGLTSTQYGVMFVPQAIMAIVASLLAARLQSRLGSKRIYLLGLLANLFSMSLLIVSRFALLERPLAYGILLAATTCMGIGFGFTVPALNTLVAASFPKNLDNAVLGLNALLGLGTALAPVFVAVFVGLGIWWGLPLLVGLLLLGLLFLSAGESLNEGELSHPSQTQRNKFPMRFWIFAAFVLLYAVCETMNGNWASLYLTKHFGASTAVASLALTMFWSMVTVGRVLFAVLERWLPGRLVGRGLPFLVSIAFLLSAWMPKTSPSLGVLSFALAGIGCSALLPLAISFGQRQLTTIAASVAGGLIAFYQIGYGIAAFGVGPLQTWAGLDLSAIYSAGAVVALAMAGLSFVITREPAAPA